MSIDALRQGLGEDWGFESFPEYMDAVEQLGTAINVAAMVGHTAVRLNVMGEEASERTAVSSSRRNRPWKRMPEPLPLARRVRRGRWPPRLPQLNNSTNVP